MAHSYWAGSAVGWASSWALRERNEGGGREQAARGGADWDFGPKPEGRVLLLFISASLLF